MRRSLSASIIAILMGATLAWLGFMYVIPATGLGASLGTDPARVARRPGTEVERLLDVEIDHAVAIDMVGFQRTIDAIGGYRICTDYALRDPKSGLELEPGCHMADGETTVALIRSRHTQRRVEGRWEPVPAVSDLARMERERRLLVDMLRRVGEDVGLDDLLDLASELAPYVTVDDELSLRDAAKLVWQLREDEVRTVEIPVIDDRLDTGAEILVPTADPSDLVGDL